MLNKLIKRIPYSTLQSIKLSSQNFKKNPPILVYTAPKTGSSTVVKSLVKLELPNPIYKTHVLSYSGMKDNENWEISRNPSGKASNLNVLSKLLRKKIDQNKDKNIHWKIITLVRDPIARIVSSLFQGINKGRHPDLLDKKSQLKIEDTLNLLQSMFGDFIRLSENDTCWWFDQELKQVFGIDVCRYPYDHEKGYIRICENRADVLVIRLEDLDRCLDNAISEFLGTNKFEMVLANITKNKKVASEYTDIKKQIQIPDEVCSKIYASKYAQHFYGDNYREKF